MRVYYNYSTITGQQHGITITGSKSDSKKSLITLRLVEGIFNKGRGGVGGWGEYHKHGSHENRNIVIQTKCPVRQNQETKASP